MQEHGKSKRLRVSPSIEQAMLPPQAVELEEAVIGALLVDRTALAEVINFLQPDMFYREDLKIIYGAIKIMFAKSMPIDTLTIVQQLKSTKELELVGGAFSIAKLADKVGSSLNTQQHSRIIAEKYFRREIIRISGQLYHLAFDESEDVFDILEKAQKDLYDITLLTSKKDVAHISGPIGEVLKEMDDTKENDENGLPWGFGEIDDLTAGLHAPDLIIVAARPGVGKTAFALCIARNIVVAQKKPVAIFSLEMSAKQLTRRLLAIESNLNVVKLRDNDFQPVERMNVISSGALLSNTPLYIDDTAGLTLFEFKAKARRLVEDKKVEFIIVDYLQLMEIESSSKVSNREQEISKISRGLKVAAKELDIPIMALSQLSRETEKRKMHRPILSDLRESGSIEQDADMVMFLFRPEYHGETKDKDGKDLRGMAEVIIAKHRNGAIDSAFLRYRAELTKFENYIEENETKESDKLDEEF